VALEGWPVTLRFLIAVLATWRVAHLVSREDGPYDVIVWLRRRAGNGAVGRLMDCPHCVGLWVAVPAAAWLTTTPADWIMTWIGVAGGASIAEHLIAREPRP
jgi:hypothetical protein